MSSVDQQVANQVANIERSTGRSLADWIEIVRASGLEKHGQQVAMLKADHGLGHGNANLLEVAPPYEAVVAAVWAFGDDIELAPKKSYVSLRRRKQFAQVGPSGGQLEVGLNLPGSSATERLRPTSGMATHRVRIDDAGGLDAELLAWLREAYDRA